MYPSILKRVLSYSSRIVTHSLAQAGAASHTTRMNASRSIAKWTSLEISFSSHLSRAATLTMAVSGEADQVSISACHKQQIVPSIALALWL